MPSIPVWVISLAISVLRQLGVISWADKLAVKAGLDVIEDVEDIKTSSAPEDYPSGEGKNGEG